ncbi:hypothetical protein ACP70R_047088 [Stipagrostis hirtigluma subsp. patula]
MAVTVDIRGCIQLLRSCGAATGRQLLLRSGHVPSSLHSRRLFHSIATPTTPSSRLSSAPKTFSWNADSVLGYLRVDDMHSKCGDLDSARSLRP